MATDSSDKSSAVAPRTDNSPASAKSVTITAAPKASVVTPHAGTNSTLMASTTAVIPRVDTKPAPNTPLSHLNSRSGNLAQWDISIALPRIEEYEYVWDGKQRKGQVFRCMLTSLLDAAYYCRGEVRKEKGQPNAVQKALDKFKNGLRFRISKVTLNSKDKQEYNSCKHKVYGIDENHS